MVYRWIDISMTLCEGGLTSERNNGITSRLHRYYLWTHFSMNARADILQQKMAESLQIYGIQTLLLNKFGVRFFMKPCNRKQQNSYTVCLNSVPRQLNPIWDDITHSTYTWWHVNGSDSLWWDIPLFLFAWLNFLGRMIVQLFLLYIRTYILGCKYYHCDTKSSSWYHLP